MTVPDELRHELWAAFTNGKAVDGWHFDGAVGDHWTAGVDRMLEVLKAFTGDRLPGVAYTDREGRVTYLLDRDVMPVLPRPERDVAIALMRYALTQLEAQDD